MLNYTGYHAEAESLVASFGLNQVITLNTYFKILLHKQQSYASYRQFQKMEDSILNGRHYFWPIAPGRSQLPYEQEIVRIYRYSQGNGGSDRFTVLRRFYTPQSPIIWPILDRTIRYRMLAEQKHNHSAGAAVEEDVSGRPKRACNLRKANTRKRSHL